MVDQDSPLGIAVDAMGGDSGPRVVVEGVVDYIRQSRDPLDVWLVGDTQRIELELARYGNLPVRPHIEHTTQSVDMEEKAAASLRRKKDSSIARGIQLQKDGKASAFVSAGNTAAVVASSLLALGRIRGVRRPGIGTFMPSAKGGFVLLDAGATTDCKPVDLRNFAIMGSVYAERIMHREDPRVGLINIGSESSKGNELTQEAHKLLSETPGINFIGNVEAMGLFHGEADVAVCDGFVGNVVLKFAEGVFEWMVELVRSEVSGSAVAKAGALLIRPSFRRVKQQLSYEQYGGAPLLGVNGMTTICHGRSSAKAIANAVRAASDFVRFDINGEIETKLDMCSEVPVES